MAGHRRWQLYTEVQRARPCQKLSGNPGNCGNLLTRVEGFKPLVDNVNKLFSCRAFRKKSELVIADKLVLNQVLAQGIALYFVSVYILYTRLYCILLFATPV